MANRKTADDLPKYNPFPIGPNFDEDSVLPQILVWAEERALQITKNKDDAKDVAQEVAFKCLILIRDKKLYHDPAAVAELVKVKVRYEALNLLAREKHRSSRDRVHHDEITGVAHTWSRADSSTEESDLTWFLEKALDKVPAPRRKALLVVREVAGKNKYEVAAAQLGLTSDTVRAYTYQAQKQLRDELVAAEIYAPPKRRKRK